MRVERFEDESPAPRAEEDVNRVQALNKRGGARGRKGERGGGRGRPPERTGLMGCRSSGCSLVVSSTFTCRARHRPMRSSRRSSVTCPLMRRRGRCSVVIWRRSALAEARNTEASVSVRSERALGIPRRTAAANRALLAVRQIGGTKETGINRSPCAPVTRGD